MTDANGYLINSGIVNNNYGYFELTNGTVLSVNEIANNGGISSTAPYYYPVFPSDDIDIDANLTLPTSAIFKVPNGINLRIRNGVTFTF